jgi:hypothetical protein
VKDDKLVPLAKLLVLRLERLSPDSSWAHQASGIRGDLIRFLELIEREESAGPQREEMDAQKLKNLIARSFELLEKAARELRG